MWVGLAAAALLVGGPAEARFGKKSGGNSSSSSNGGSSSSSSSSGNGNSSSYHEATGVGQPYRGGGGGGGGGGQTRLYRPNYYYDPYYHPWYGGYYGWGFGYRPLFYSAPTYTVVEQPAPQQSGSDISASFSAGAALLGSSSGTGSGFDLGAAFEGERLGFNLTWTGVYVPADDGSGGVDSIKLFNGMLTYSVLSRPQGRLRLEAGGMSAWAPDLVVLGPGLGVSGVLGLVGPLGLDGSVRMTPFPFRQVDAQAGLTVGLGPLGFRGGFRGVYLDDAGIVDGVVHTDVFAGPYLGLELVL